MAIVQPNMLAFARRMIGIALKKYGEHPLHRRAAAVALLANSTRIARAFLGEQRVRRIVDQVLAETPLSPIEGVD